MSRIFQLPKQVVINGGVASGGATANFYLTGTTTRTNTYSDSALSVPHTNPVIASSAGVFPVIYLDPDIIYRLILNDSVGALIYDEDPIQDALTQANIGLISNPRTAAEISAGVTPVDYTYAAGNVLRYGADNTGIANASTAVQNAVDSNLDVLFPDGTYLLQSAVTLRTGSNLFGSATLKTNGTNTILSAIGSLGTVSALTANANRGAVSFAGAVGTGSTYTAGSGFYLRSNAQPVGHATHRAGEIGVVESVSADTVSVENEVLGDYLTSDTASAAPVTFLENIRISGLRFTNDTYDSAPTSQTSSLIYLELVRNSQVSGCSMTKNNSAGINVYSCLNVSVTNNTVSRMRNDAANSILGYGVQIGFNSQSVTISGNSFRDCRHAVTTGTGTASSLTANYGVQRSIVISSNAVSNCASIGLDTHEDSDGVTITGNSVVGCNPSGIQVRSYRTSVTGNTVTSCTGKGIRISNLALDTVVSGNTIRGIGLNSVDGYGIEIDGPSVTASGNHISDCYSHGIIVSTNATQFISLIGNVCKNNGNGGTGDGININRGGSITRLTVIGNTCSDNQGGSSTQRYGFRIESGTSTSPLNCLVKNNNFTTNLTGSYSNAGTGSPKHDNSNIGQGIDTITSTDATPSVAGLSVLKLTGTTNITDFDDGIVGQTITILADAAITIEDSAAIRLNGSANYAMNLSDTLTLTMFNNQLWRETARSNN